MNTVHRMLTTFPQCNFSLEFLEILSQNHIRYHWLSVSGNSKIKHCGIVINMPFWGYMLDYLPILFCRLTDQVIFTYISWKAYRHIAQTDWSVYLFCRPVLSVSAMGCVCLIKIHKDGPYPIRFWSVPLLATFKNTIKTMFQLTCDAIMAKFLTFWSYQIHSCTVVQLDSLSNDYLTEIICILFLFQTSHHPL